MPSVPVDRIIEGLILGVWALINLYFTVKTMKVTIEQNKREHDLSINGIGGKARVLDAKIFNDRLIDVACTKELDLRLWKADQFREEIKR